MEVINKVMHAFSRVRSEDGDHVDMGNRTVVSRGCGDQWGGTNGQMTARDV